MKELMINLDYPDVDVIRVEDTYYIVSTTMYFMPGCEILRSKDLVNWEHAAYVYDRLDSTKGQTLTGEQNIYSQGMWAASIRYHKGTFYICFVCNDTHKTYLYTSDKIEGPWKKQFIEGFYHDCSLLFDDDDRVFIVYGNKNIYLTELNEELTGPKEGGIHRLIVSEENNILGYEGTHFYKINGKYYLFFIHSRPDHWRRTECCFMADTVDGEYKGWECFNDDIGYCEQGVAQGGIVDTPDGKWYAILFQDRGGSGRFPVLIPVTWEGDIPVFGEHGTMPEDFCLEAAADPALLPLADSDDFRYRENLGDQRIYGSFGLKSMWQFNHEPDEAHFKLDTQKGEWIVENAKICQRLDQARNTITQRMTYPVCSAEVTLDGSNLENGDIAGLCALQYSYGCIALKKEADKFSVIMMEHSYETESEVICACEEIPQGKVSFRLEADYTKMKDTIRFFYRTTGEWKALGIDKKVDFNLKHFTGCRAALVSYATKKTGGKAVFSDFGYNK